MKDPQIRRVLLSYLRKTSPITSATLNEVGICRGNTIIDVLNVTDKLEGYEIKSDNDTLTRLPRQVEDYGKVCDTCTIVVGEKYSSKIEKHVPDWWGIYVVRGNQLEVVRAPSFNGHVDTSMVVEMLWKEEAQQLLKEHNLYEGKATFNRKKLHSAIYSNVPFGYVHDFVLDRFKQRKWRGNKVR